MVGFEARAKKSSIQMVLADRSERRNVKFLKTTASAASLAARFGSLAAAGKAIIDGDPEIDSELTGKITGKTRKVFVDKSNAIVYHINQTQVLYNAD
jgi:hypothetical protein